MTKEQVLERLRPDARARAVARQVVYFVLGLLASRALVFDRCAPFGVALAAACPGGRVAAVVAGAALGYVLPGPVTVPMHNLAALGACTAIRWALEGMGRWGGRPGFAAFCAGLPLVCTGLCVALVNGSTAVGTAYYVAEGLLAAAWAYLFSRSLSLRNRAGRSALLPQEMACLALAAGAFLLSLSQLHIGPVSLGGVLAVLGTLVASRFGGVPGGAVAGTALGGALSLSSAGLSGLTISYGVGGLAAGLFAQAGRLPSACAFVLGSALVTLTGGLDAARLSAVLEVAAATVLFLLLPERAGGGLLRKLWPGEEDEPPRAQDLRHTVVARLDHAAGAMEEVADTVEELGERMEKLRENPPGRKAAAAAAQAAQQRQQLVRQFATVGNILEEMAAEFELHERCDAESAREVAQLLQRHGLQPLDVCCALDRWGRMRVEALALHDQGARVNKANLTREVSHACGRAFALPAVSRTQGSWRLVFREHPCYRVAVGSARHNCGNATLCGDSTRCFEDGVGRFIAVLSDGMGTGGRAAVDGVLVSDLMTRLVQAGVGFDSALQIVNAAMGAKSEDESTATVDLACIDLYTGEAQFLKAGAPMGFVRHEGRVRPIDAPGLPVGILDSASFHRAQELLEEGDLVLLVSDGALCEGGGWISEMLESWPPARTPQQLAEAVVAGAVARRSDGHDDDVTAIAMRLLPL